MRKMDEMEMSINLKALRWSYLFTVIALFLWTVYDFIKTHTLTLAFFLLISQNLIYFYASQIYKWKMGDKEGKTSIILTVAGAALLLLIFGIILFFFHK